MRTVLIIPALNEEGSIGLVLGEIRPDLYCRIFVVDNGSTDRTSEVAAAHGATVLHEPHRGYGAACLRAIAELPKDTEAVVFMDGDGADVPAEAELLLRPIREGKADLVIGSRPLGVAESGSLAPHQRWGNRLATFLLRLCCGHRFTDLGPFRAIRADQLARLGMSDPNYGWTVEMQMRAVQRGLRVVEVPVSYRRRRQGTSKVSGNTRGSLAAGAKILWTIVRLAMR